MRLLPQAVYVLTFFSTTFLRGRLLHAQTLIDIFYWPLVRWFEQQKDVVRRAETVCVCPVTRADIDAVFSNVDELISFSRYGTGHM